MDPNKREAFEEALKGRKLPILTLDNKWYKMFQNLQDYPEIVDCTKRLNNLLKRQGKLNTEAKEIKSIKKKLMTEIVPMVDEFNESGSSSLEKKIEEHKRLIQESNDKLLEYTEELMDIPKEIETVNYELMLLTMEYVYDRLKSNTEEILEIAKWILSIRDELKSKIIQKQEKELINHHMFAYMHDIIGMQTMELFDMKYNPFKQVPQKGDKKKSKPKKEDQKQ